MNNQRWPDQSSAQMNAFYGNPDMNRDGVPDRRWEDEYLITVQPPYRLVLAWDTKAEVKRIRVNKRCADSLIRVLEGIKAHFVTQKGIEQARMHLYGGCYNFRLMRGGSSLSIHSWGAAIDLDPELNWFGRKYDATKGMMPRAVVELFQKEGWTWGGHWRKGDAMHFQAANE